MSFHLCLLEELVCQELDLVPCCLLSLEHDLYEYVSEWVCSYLDLDLQQAVCSEFHFYVYLGQ